MKLLQIAPLAYWRLDEIAVFDRALTTEEIIALHPGNASAPSEHNLLHQPHSLASLNG